MTAKKQLTKEEKIIKRLRGEIAKLRAEVNSMKAEARDFQEKLRKERGWRNDFSHLINAAMEETLDKYEQRRYW